MSVVSASDAFVDGAPPRELDLGGAPRGRRSEIWWRGAIVLEVIVFLGLWELAALTGLFPRNFMPPPSQIAISFVNLFSLNNFWTNLQYTLTNLFVGLVVACVVGIGLGLAVGWFKALETTIGPLIWVLYVTPKVALAPIIILWLGIGTPSQVALVFLLAVYPLLLNTIEGVKTIDVSLIRAGRVFGASGLALFTKIILPATLPFILVGLRRGVALGFIGAILGEFLGGSVGIGKTLQLAVFNFRLADALAIVLIMLIVTNVALKAVDLVRRRVAPWHQDTVAGGA